MVASAPLRDGRFRELDGLRGIAALAVVLYHFTDYLGAQGVPEPRYFPSLWWGEYGVHLFFLISGFVILMTARRVKVASDFVISRVSRLYPVYWIAVTVSIALALIFPLPNTQIGWVDRLMNYTMVQRLLLFDNVDPVYWTLAVEMQFYIIMFTLLVLTRNRITDRVVVALACGWILLSLILGIIVRPHTLGVGPQFVETPWKILLNVLLVEYGPLFSAGMLCFLARRDRKFVPLAMTALASVPAVSWIVRGAEHGLITAVIVLLFGVVVLRERTGILLLRPVQFYGRISYSLYVGHLLTGTVVIMYTAPLIGRDLSVILALAVVTAVAVLYHRAGEVYLSRRFKAGLESIRERVRSRRPEPLEQR